MTSPNNRILFVQFMVDSVELYNSYKYDAEYGKLKVFVSKFLDYPPVDISTTTFHPNIDQGTADVRVNEGKTFMFSMFANEIENNLKSFFIDFQVMLETDKEDKIKAGIENVVVGYTRIKMENELNDLIKAVDTVTSENPVIKEIESGYVIRQNTEQVGTIFLGIRFTMFGKSITTSLGAGKAYNKNQSGLKEKSNLEQSQPKPQQVTSKAPSNNEKQMVSKLAPNNQTPVRYHKKPDDTGKDLNREYSYIYTEMNGQVVDFKISYESKVCGPPNMAGAACIF